jgi:hypothetical protein
MTIKADAFLVRGKLGFNDLRYSLQLPRQGHSEVQLHLD